MAKKICNICNTRPVDKAAGIDDACVPCWDEGGWENAHNDNHHDSMKALLTPTPLTRGPKVGVEGTDTLDGCGAVQIRKIASEYGIKNVAKFKSEELRAMVRELFRDEMTGCWICHPELNEARKAKKTRKASDGERPSRKGQKINVPLRAPGEAKAAVVVNAAPEAPIKVEREKHGTVRLDLTTSNFVLILVWDEQGRYNYEGSVASVGGKAKKVRNVAEALRLLAEVGII